MSPQITGVIFIIIMLILIYSRMWIGLAMLFTGFWGIVAISGWDASLMVLATVPYRNISNYIFAAIPLFLLMGVIVYSSDFGSDLYGAANKWLGQIRGGLAMATNLAAAILGVITDSMVAVITLGKVAMPEMKKYNYDNSVSAGSIVGGASLASLVPPSIGFILYGMLTGESIGKLYIAAILPSIFFIVLMLTGIYIRIRLQPGLAPAAPATSFREKISSLKSVWGVGMILIFILAGIYAGVFTPTEAGAMGAFFTLVLSLITRRLKLQSLLNSLIETTQMTSMIVLLVIGAYTFTNLMAMSQLPFVLTDFISDLNVSKYVILAAIVLIYLILGMFTDIMAAILISIPILFPLVKHLGFDTLWFGVLIVIVIELGSMTPPIGMNAFVLSGITNIPMNTIFRGVWFYLAIILIGIVIMTIFPEIVTFLPNTM